jgi:hypothetical protein
MAVTYRVHENAVLAYMANVDDLVWDVVQTTRELGRLYAPSRTGRLRGSIRAARPKRVGLYQYTGTVSASVRHALWVHDGVKGRIYPKRGKYLTVPHRPGPLSGSQLRAIGGKGKGKLYFLAKNGVRGQRPQPFLQDALTQSLGRNGLLYVRVS